MSYIRFNDLDQNLEPHVAQYFVEMSQALPILSMGGFSFADQPSTLTEVMLVMNRAAFRCRSIERDSCKRYQMSRPATSAFVG